MNEEMRETGGEVFMKSNLRIEINDFKPTKYKVNYILQQIT